MDTLNGNNRNPRFWNNTSMPDTDCRNIDMSKQGLTVSPNLMFDHTRLQYNITPRNSNSVYIGNFINGEERSLHTIVLNNAVGLTKDFIFSPSYVFLDIVLTANTLTVTAGEAAVFFGVIILGKMYLLTSVESTN